MRIRINLRPRFEQLRDALANLHMSFLCVVILTPPAQEKALLTLRGVAVEFLRQLRRDVRDDQRAFAFVMQLEHMTDAMNLSDQRRLARRNPKTRTQSPRAQRT